MKVHRTCRLCRTNVLLHGHAPDCPGLAREQAKGVNLNERDVDALRQYVERVELLTAAIRTMLDAPRGDRGPARRGVRDQPRAR